MPSVGAATHSRAYQRHIRHKRHVNTARRVGIGAAGGAAIGGLAEAGKALALVPLPARALVLNTTHIRTIRGTGAMTAQLVKAINHSAWIDKHKTSASEVSSASDRASVSVMRLLTALAKHQAVASC